MTGDAKRILLIRLSAIGDVVMASPLIHAFRAAHPDAHIAWLAERPAAALVQCNPELNEVIVWPRSEWHRLWREGRRLQAYRAFRDFTDELRARRFDVAIDLQGLLKSGIWARLCGARERIGLGSKEGSQWLMTRVLSRQGGEPRIGSEYYGLARELRLPHEPFRMTVTVNAEDEAYAAALAHQLDASYAVICPFTTRPQKHWFADRWADLAHQLETRLGLKVVMLGGHADADAAQEIAAQAQVTNLAGRSLLRESAAVIKHASLLIGVDTGLTHMGIAFGVPTLALFGSTRPYLETTRANAVVLYEGLPCSPCRRNPSCGGAFDCMRALTVDAVMNAAQRVYARGRAHD